MSTQHPGSDDLPAWENKRLREESAVIWDDLTDERNKKQLYRGLLLLAMGYEVYRFITWMGWL